MVPTWVIGTGSGYSVGTTLSDQFFNGGIFLLTNVDHSVIDYTNPIDLVGILKMKLSTRGRYGTRMLLDLAMHYGGGPVLLKHVAGRQGISLKYLEQVAARLRAAGLIKSSRGARGGYELAKPPGDIRLGVVIQILEGSLSPVDCLEVDGICSRIPFCVARDIWAGVKKATLDFLESITLEDLVQRQKEKERQPGMYYI